MHMEIPPPAGFQALAVANQANTTGTQQPSLHRSFFLYFFSFFFSEHVQSDAMLVDACSGALVDDVH